MKIQNTECGKSLNGFQVQVEVMSISTSHYSEWHEARKVELRE